MFLQHWVTCRCRPSIEQTIGAVGTPPPPIIPFPDQLRAAAIDVTMSMVTLIMPSEVVSMCGQGTWCGL